MKNDIGVGTKVILVSFNGKSKAPKGTEPVNDFWQLIGAGGTVVVDAPTHGISKGRVLVKFDGLVSAFDLPSHNEIANSLWILRSDLKIEDRKI